MSTGAGAPIASPSAPKRCATIHLDGDPDRPVILGAIPNADTMSPVVSANATQSRIKTRGSILFELEDDA